MTKITLMILWQDTNLQKVEFGALRQPRDAAFQAEPAASAKKKVSQISFTTWNSTAGETTGRGVYSLLTQLLHRPSCASQVHPGPP